MHDWSLLYNKDYRIKIYEERNKEIIKYNNKEFNCSLAFTLLLIGDKYKSLILFHLKDGAQRSGELQKSITDISNRMFTYSIRALEKDMLEKLLKLKLYVKVKLDELNYFTLEVYPVKQQELKIKTPDNF